MELIMYHLVEVKTKKQEKEFLTLPALLYKVWEDKNWIGPLYKDTKNFFNPGKNPLLKEGESNRWLLYDVNKHLIGRIAAFYWKKSPEEEDVPTGHFGFFECTEDRKGAEYLFKVASEWLAAKGIKAMKGPFHLGGPGFFTGSLTRGFFEPVFGMPYNFSFYNNLFIEYGFRAILKSETYKISLSDSPNWQFISKKTVSFYHDLNYRIETFEPKNCEKFSKDFTYIYNKAWKNVPGMATMTLQRAMNRCRRMRPILVKKTILFLYFEDEPIAFFVAVPDIHQVIKKFKGKYNLFDRLWLWLSVKVLKRISTLSGLIYGIVPGYERGNPEAVLLDSFKELLKLYDLKFNELRLSRIGDFAPGMKKIAEQLGGEIYHQYITYQLLFDEVEKEKDNKMKVLLISPQGSNIYAKMEVGLPPLGVAYLAAVIREKGNKVKIIDKSIERRELTSADFVGFDLVGISADTPRYPEAVEIARIAKKTGKKVVMGGYHVTFLDKEALETGVVDIIVRGEAEEIMVNLVEALENNDDLSKVKGISFIRNGKIIRTPVAPPPRNLDAMPFPARDLLPMDKYSSLMAGLPITNLITSRGCPFNCYFCSSSKFGGLKWRYRSAKSIADEMEILYNDYGYRAFAFMDDNFTLSKRRVMEFADELEKRHMNDIIWWCFSRVDILIRNEDMVKRMAEVGAFQIFLGLESHNEQTLDDYGKNLGNKEQDQAIALLQKYGINIHGSFIVGDISETKEMAMQTAKWVQKVNPRVAQFSILTPYPGTALYNDVEREGRFLHKRWELFDALHATVKTDGMTPDKVQKILIKDYRMAYLNKKRLFHPRKYSPEVTQRLENLHAKQDKLKNMIKPISFFGTFWMEMQRTRPKKLMAKMEKESNDKLSLHVTDNAVKGLDLTIGDEETNLRDGMYIDDDSMK